MRQGIFVIDISYLRCPRKSSVSQRAHTHTNFPQILPSQKMTPPLISTVTLDLLFLSPVEVLKQNPLASPAASIANGFPGGSESKEPACSAGDPGSAPGSGRSRRRAWKPTPVFLPGKSHGREAWRTTVCGFHKRVGHD